MLVAQDSREHTMTSHHYNSGSQERICLFGFGAQGRAWAQNLKDRGGNPVVCLRPGSERIVAAREAGLLVVTDPVAAAAECEIAALMIPDAAQPGFYREVLKEALPKHAAIAFAHGFALHTRQIEPRSDLDALLIAPLAHGDAVRRAAIEGNGTACVVAIAQDATGRARQRADALVAGVCGSGPAIPATVAEEVEIDLFAEQAVLCGGIPELARAAFETLTAAGYNEQIAYHCCLRELSPIVELMHRFGIAGMRDRISDTARYGALTRGPRVIDDRVRDTLADMLGEIRSGAFSRELIGEAKSGWKRTEETRAEERRHLLEQLHRRLNG